MKLRKSKHQRKLDKQKKVPNSDSESESVDGESDNDGQRQTRRQANIFDPLSIYKPGADGDIENDSDLEDLMELEKIHIERKKRREDRRLLRKQ